MIQLRRSIEVMLTAIALTATVAMQLTTEDPLEQILSGLDATTCYEESEVCSLGFASTWQFLRPF